MEKLPKTLLISTILKRNNMLKYFIVFGSLGFLYSWKKKAAFLLNQLVEVHEYYLTNLGDFGKIGRASKQIRDQVLLAKIDKALDTYDHVFITFGGSHLVAVKPVLKYIFEKHK